MTRASFLVLLGLSFGSAVHAQESEPADEAIAFWVGEALREDPRVRSASIDVDCKDGVVNLSGTVRNLSERSYAGMIARRVQGVRRLTNDIRVQPVPRADDALRDEIQGRLTRMSFLHSSSITVVVKNAVATLSGSAKSTSQSHEAEVVASEVRGIRGIKNNIQVLHDTTRDDAEIKADVLASFRRDVYLASLPISCSVTAGVVNLQGRAGNAYQRQRAESLTWQIEHVRDVQNRIVVEWFPDRSLLKPPAFPDDEKLATQVTAQLKRDTRVQADGISVKASGGKVTLRGNVPTQFDRDMAFYIARDVRGVVAVSNLLGVRAQIRADQDIEDDILYLVQTDVMLQGRSLSVQSIDGFVTLSGRVNSFQSKVQAANVAGRVRGVRGVQNNIEVTTTTQHLDSSIAARVRTRLQANAEVRWSANRIKVQVSGGVVTLTGDVGRIIERREAARMAFLTAGVTGVVNMLTVNSVHYPWERLNRDSAPLGDQYPIYRGDFFDRPGPIRL